jgi:hypothetical protein
VNLGFSEELEVGSGKLATNARIIKIPILKFQIPKSDIY